MTVSLQLFSFLISFLFGVIFHFLTDIHFEVIKKCSKILKGLSSILFMIDIVLAYVLIMYTINEGMLHIYFLLFLFLGFFIYGILHKRVKFGDIWDSIIEKWRH